MVARTSRFLTRVFSGLLGYVGRYVGWLLLTGFVTLGGATVLMLFKDWTLDAIVTSMLAWPALAIGVFLALPIALFPLGRFYFYSAIGGGLMFNAFLLFA